MKQLASKGDISDGDVFEFIGFVSRLYTDRLDRHHRRSIMEMQEEMGEEGQ
jgi:hypothetical protein